VPVCITVTHLDGLVLARSAFHHSVNYRSAVIFGSAREISDLDEKRRAFEVIVEHVVPGRTPETRMPNDFETKYTRVLAVDIVEASAKVRSGGPKDDAEDLALPHWAGIVPLRITPGAPVPDAALAGSVAVPAYVTAYRRPGS
jgi:hypothetical protein